MSRRDDLTAMEEEMADARAQIEALQSAAADAEARAATVESQLAEARDKGSALESEAAGVRAELSEAQAEREAAQAQATAAQAEAEGMRARLSELTLKYREARLAAAPHIPADLVPGGSVGEIDEQMEAAQRVVSELQDRLQSESRSARVPVGSPPRRAPDLAGLSAAEKIKLGLQERGRR